MLNKKMIITSYLVLALGLTACSNGNVNDTNKTNDTNGTTTNGTNTPKGSTVTETNDDTSSVTDKTDTKEPTKQDTDNNKATDGVVSDTDDKVVIDNTETTQSKTEDIAQYKDIQMTASQAYNTFLEKKPGMTVKKLALDYDNKVYYYKIHGYDETNEYEIKMDAATGAIVKEKKEVKETETKVITAEQIGKIDELVSNSLQDAANDFESIEWELEVDNARTVLEIDIDRNSDDLEYKYDIDSGELLEKD